MTEPTPSTPARHPRRFRLPQSPFHRFHLSPAAAAVLPTPRLVTVNDINWSGVFDFIHVFRGFRLAINPAKLAIAAPGDPADLCRRPPLRRRMGPAGLPQ